MFQSFDATSRPEQGPPRLAALREVMAADGLDGFLVPRADAHQGENVAPCDERLAWLTGFTGSAGFAAVLADEAGLFVDGRYRLQVREQAADVFTPVDRYEVQLGDWLAERLSLDARVGFDPWLHTVGQVAALRERLDEAGILLAPCDNLVDRLWDDRPPPPDRPFRAHDTALAGESAADKRARLAAELREAGQRAALLTLPDSIAWLLNIRGADVARTPVPRAFALLRDDGSVELFCGPGQADPVADHLGPDVAVLPRDGLRAALSETEGPVRLDPASAPQVLADTLAEADVEVVHGDDPCLLPKARKTDAELAGMREAHLRDGAAMCRFLAWLDATAPDGGLTEIAVVTALESFRRETNALQDISFETICGAGPNGAIVHYRVTEATDRPVQPGELLLVDSGGQYLDGTTDITRTVIVGTPEPEQRACFTRVLQGMIAVSRARFPKGVAGAHLDVLARTPLWLAGLDYDHGTGHGVGAYLGVHEGPQALSRRSGVPLEPGMILSNEPGYYRADAFGIRIENLLAVREAPPIEGGDARVMYDFETLTWVPIDRRLIDGALLSRPERDWIDAYHAATFTRIAPRLEGAALAWLEQACAPLPRPGGTDS
ncbi:aminopeptidase P [Oceanicola granulosus HTCC2516]|uniref:Aminopeptidase P n=1 Tax=Oceanicola granulosus (strain ATCC BAA-861 / DSM 15982 / KCTC 12143 / HTCC2516) TaxID=314256 RepID=Q2CIX3_OCEGH|nr:aminopeptidase P family protein [Oceanicola granulosus]EAR52466.1 aminopeptidase P [Oceanicola granulosus HTCC2516]